MWSRYSAGYRAFKIPKTPLKVINSYLVKSNLAPVVEKEISALGHKTISNKNMANLSYCRWLKQKQLREALPKLCCWTVDSRGEKLKTNESVYNIPQKNIPTEMGKLLSGIEMSFSKIFVRDIYTLNNIFSQHSVRFYSYSHHRTPNVRNRRRNLELSQNDPFGIEEDYSEPTPVKSATKEFNRRTPVKDNELVNKKDDENEDKFAFHDDYNEPFVPKRNVKVSQFQVENSSSLMEKDQNNNPDEYTEGSFEALSPKENARISLLFPNPKSTLNVVTSKLGISQPEWYHKHTPTKTKGKSSGNRMPGWISQIKLTWPEIKMFECHGVTKTQSSHKTALKAVHWLHSINKIKPDGSPIYSKEVISELKKEINKPIPFNLDTGMEQKVMQLIDTYNKEIDPIFQEAHKKVQANAKAVAPTMSADSEVTEMEEEELDEETNNVHNLNISCEREYSDPIFGVPVKEKNPEMVKGRNAELLRRSSDASKESELPITKFKNDIIRAVDTNRAVVIRGAPGCGKSTRVPHYLIDAWSARGTGGHCNILVSEPRRVAALSLAARVAEERGERLGDVVGHQVRLSTCMPRPPGGSILYCTAGTLLRRLATTPDILGCSHLVLDEAHERSADSDAVMALAKRAMKLNRNLKVIVMSATIDTELFSEYFDGCPILEIPGFTYPVESHFLEDFSNSRLSLLKTWETSKRTDGRPLCNTFEVCDMIKWVDKNKSDGAILCFLPGWSEIKKVKDNLEYHFQNRNAYSILPIHSRLSNQDQKKIFTPAPRGTRKIILATNIAETSITINDVSYVIDTGIHKEHRLMSEQGISSLDSSWVSQANCTQRKGRAGRVKPGECFHMYTKEKMESFAENPTPEILRVPLEKTVLDCKTYSESTKALDFLQQFPQPPSPEAIQLAVQDLVELGALDESENLTALGRRIASFTTHPKLSKALVNATIFKVTSPIVDLATILGNNTDLFSVGIQQRDAVRNTKRRYHPTSDHQAMYWLHEQYMELMREKGYKQAEDFCYKMNIRKEKMKSIGELRNICLNHLEQCKMVPRAEVDIETGYKKHCVEDQYSTVDELVKGVLLSGLNSLIYLKYTVKTKGKLSKVKDVYTDRGQHAFIATDSVNHNIHKQIDSGILLHCQAVHSEERRGVLVRDTSLLAPLTAFLFSPKVKKVYNNSEFAIYEIGGKSLKLQCPAEQQDMLEEFRNILWNIIQYYIENKGFAEGEMYQLELQENFHTTNNSEIFTVDKYRDDFVKVLAKVLNDIEIIVDRETSVKKKPDEEFRSLFDDDSD